MAYRIMLVENDRLLLEQIANVISSTDGFELVARYQTVSDALGQGSVFHPNIIMLDVDHPRAFAAIGTFHANYPETVIICMGEEWQADRATHCVRSGASGYIVRPSTTQELKESVETYAKSGMEFASETMAFFSAKGKSGKSTLIANLALALGRRSGEQVGIIDADLQFGDMTVFFSLEPSMTIYEAVRDIKYLSPVTLKPYFTPVNDNVHVLCGTRTPNLIDRISIEGFESLLEMAQSLFRYVLIDIPPGFNPTSIAAVEKAKSTYVVTMLNGAYEIQHAQRALEVMNSLDNHEERVHTIFTRVQSTDIAARHQLETELGYPVAAMIPNEYLTVSKAANDGRMAVDIEPDSPLTRSVNKLAETIMGKKHIRWAKP